MIEALLKNPTIADYVVLYPKSQWRRWIESTLVYGIKRLQVEYPNHLTISDLAEIAESDIEGTSDQINKYSSMRQELQELNYALRRHPQQPSQHRAEGESISRSSSLKASKRSRTRHYTPRATVKTTATSPRRWQRLARTERKQRKLMMKKQSQKMRETVKNEPGYYQKRRPKTSRQHSPPDTYRQQKQDRLVLESYPERDGVQTERRTMFLTKSDWYGADKTPSVDDSWQQLPDYNQDPIGTRYETKILSDNAQPTYATNSSRPSGELLNIAEDFLRDPLMLHLSSSPNYAYTFAGMKPTGQQDSGEVRRVQIDESNNRYASANEVQMDETPSPALSYGDID